MFGRSVPFYKQHSKQPNSYQIFRLAEVEVGDETGTISLRARDDQIDVLQKVLSHRNKKNSSLNSGAVVLRNCTIELYQNKHLRLAITKWGKLSFYPDDIASTPNPPLSMNREKNISLADVSTFVPRHEDESPSVASSTPSLKHRNKLSYSVPPQQYPQNTSAFHYTGYHPMMQQKRYNPQQQQQQHHQYYRNQNMNRHNHHHHHNRNNNQQQRMLWQQYHRNQQQLQLLYYQQEQQMLARQNRIQNQQIFPIMPSLARSVSIDSNDMPLFIPLEQTSSSSSPTNIYSNYTPTSPAHPFVIQEEPCFSPTQWQNDQHYFNIDSPSNPQQQPQQNFMPSLGNPYYSLNSTIYEGGGGGDQQFYIPQFYPQQNIDQGYKDDNKK